MKIARFTAASPLALLVFATSPAAAQGAPAPAAEVKAFAPLVGNWSGSGEAHFDPSGAPTKWTAHGTYRWALGGHFVQEDFRIRFDDMPSPMVFRAYFGWDGERRRHTAIVVTNGGEVALHEVKALPDGTMMQLMLQEQQGTPYAERACFKVAGDTMTMNIELLMPEGASVTAVSGTFQRTGEAFDGAWDSPTWMGAAAHADMQRLGRMAGSYAIAGEMVMAPGQPRTKFTGDDVFATGFGGTVLHGVTKGTAEGMPGAYESHAFWARDAKHECTRAVFVSNMGEIGEMEARWVDDKLVSTSAGTLGGQPLVNRFVLEFDAKGVAKRGVGHTIVGAMPPFESFVANYTRK